MYKYKCKEEVHNKAKQIENIKVKDLINQYGLDIKGHKNLMGDVFEAWFGKPKDNNSEPDLKVSELKTTPYKKLKSGKYSSKERLVLNMINYNDLISEDFYSSHFLHKNKVLEIAFYLYNKGIPTDNQKFNHIIMFQFKNNNKDLNIIQNDWNIIHDYVNNGKADQLNEGLTNYLSACTKSSNSKKRVSQPKSDISAKPRAFSFKTSFMTQILRKYIFGNEDTDAIVKNPIELQNNSLKDIIYNRFKPYFHHKADNLLNEFKINRKAKSKYNLLAKAILNLNTDNPNFSNVDELNKASLVIKTINFNYKGINRESMSFPPFEFEDLKYETWNGDSKHNRSYLNEYLSETTFIFVVFQKNKNGENIFKGIKFYSIPDNELEGIIRPAWESTKKTIMNGVHLNYDSKRNKVSNNLISTKDKKIIHVRPHAIKSSYINDKNSSKLPVKAKWTNKPEKYSDEYMTKQSFWLNSPYIRGIVKDLLY